jgi:hypothetical protein
VTSYLSRPIHLALTLTSDNGGMRFQKSLSAKLPVPTSARDRRVKRRFSFVTNVRYRKKNGAIWEGSGSTLNMSAGGILLAADRAFQRGAQLELSLDWTGLYHDTEMMVLVVTATVVRSQGNRTALQILSHEFLEVQGEWQPKTRHVARTQVSDRAILSSPSRTTFEPRTRAANPLYSKDLQLQLALDSPES